MLQDSRRPGAISFANGSPTLDCVVQRSSASGAEVRVSNAREIPKRFKLSHGTWQRAATVVWRRSGVLGIRFDDYFRGR
jgi:hypothetical protein